MLTGHTNGSNDIESCFEEEPWLNISSFIFSVNRKDFDQSISDVLVKMTITYIYVMLGMWAKIWEPSKFQRT